MTAAGHGLACEDKRLQARYGSQKCLAVRNIYRIPTEILNQTYEKYLMFLWKFQVILKNYFGFTFEEFTELDCRAFRA